MRSYKHLFSRTLSADPGRLHFAAHSHHLWPDASHAGHLAAWNDAAVLADAKWDRIYDTVIPAAQRHVAHELNLPDPRTICFAPNTHALVQRVFSARQGELPLRVLTSDGEFNSFRRQAARWEEKRAVQLAVVPCKPFATFTERYLDAARRGDFDIAFVSHVMFQTGLRFDGIEALAARAKPDGTWVVIDGYHAFMAFPVDLSSVADRIFYIAGGYKYAMAGEGAAFLHAPDGFAPRPVDTGWFAEFSEFEGRVAGVPYAKDGSRFMGATFDPSGLYRFNAVRAMLDAEGLDTAAIAARTAVLRTTLETAVGDGKAGPLRESMILRPNASGPRARYLALRDARAASWSEALRDDKVVTDVRDDVLRIGLGLYHDADDVAALCARAARL